MKYFKYYRSSNNNLFSVMTITQIVCKKKIATFMSMLSQRLLTRGSSTQGTCPTRAAVCMLTDHCSHIHEV
jgi:hypothetical protein